MKCPAYNHWQILGTAANSGDLPMTSELIPQVDLSIWNGKLFR